MTEQEKAIIDDLFSGYRCKNGYVECYTREYYYSPDTLYNLKAVEKEDKKAAEHIARLEEMITTIKTLRKAYFERYQELSVAPLKRKAVLKRQKAYYENKVYYYFMTYDVYEDGHEEQTSNIKFPGTERKKAIDHFKIYLKEHPGIISVMDIQKGKWER